MGSDGLISPSLNARAVPWLEAIIVGETEYPARMATKARLGVIDRQIGTEVQGCNNTGGVARAPPPDGYLRNKTSLLAAPNPPFLLASTR